MNRSLKIREANNTMITQQYSNITAKIADIEFAPSGCISTVQEDSDSNNPTISKLLNK